MSLSAPSIADLDVLVKSLPPKDRELFHRLFQLSVVTGELNAPESMHPWIVKQFGSVEATARQKIVKITNKVTFEGSLFNSLRSKRPLDLKDRLHIEARVINGFKDDPLHNPLTTTPEDTFGRVGGKYSITASNIAKYDGLHGMIIFKSHNPLRFTREQIVDYLDTGWKWAQEAHKVDPEARYYFFLWNCLRRAGASLLHGHAQVVLARDSHYAKIEWQRQAALRYQQQHGSNYFQDLFRVHLALGCALEKEGTKVLSQLTPLKDKEVMLLGDSLDRSFKERVYEVLACLRDRMHVTAFNFALVTPPLDGKEGWEGFPILARVVDRGEPTSPSCDIGTMELYAASVISSDPFEVARLLKEALTSSTQVE